MQFVKSTSQRKISRLNPPNPKAFSLGQTASMLQTAFLDVGVSVLVMMR